MNRLFHPDYGLWIFCAAVTFTYGLLPAAAYLTVLPDPALLKLVTITLVGVAATWVGGHLPILDARFASDKHWLNVEWPVLVGFSWILFIGFAFVTFATAPSIPLISAFQGAAADALSQERGEFLKGRSGVWLVLPYINAFMVNTVVPYSIVIAYAAHSRLRHVLAGSFFLFSVSFLVKALFLHLVLPLLALFAIRGKLGGVRAGLWIALSTLVLLAATYLSLGIGENAGGSAVPTASELLSSAFAPTDPVQYLIWRVFAVPLFTATDTLVVHAMYFDGQPLWGATSSFVSGLFGMERVNLERFVFEYQYGEWNDLGNSNTMFLLDGFVNFGWVGVVAFGLLGGQIFRWFRLSRDIGFRALWPLFAFILFRSPLVGLMLSSGFLYMLGHALTIRVRAPSQHA